MEHRSGDVEEEEECRNRPVRLLYQYEYLSDVKIDMLSHESI